MQDTTVEKASALASHKSRYLKISKSLSGSDKSVVDGSCSFFLLVWEGFAWVGGGMLNWASKAERPHRGERNKIICKPFFPGIQFLGSNQLHLWGLHDPYFHLIPPASMSERVKITLFVKEIKMLKQVFFYFRWVFTPSMLNMREHIAKNHLKTISSLEILFSLHFWINEEQVNFNVEIFRHTGLIKNWPSSSKKRCY